MATKTIRLAAAAAFGNEIRVFAMYGPSPTVSRHDEVLATFPNTKAGSDAALAFTGAFAAQRGEWGF